MTIINPKSIAGVTSITTPSGSDNLFTVHTNNTTERIRINNDGDVIVGSGITVSPDGDIFATGVTTSTTFSGAISGTTGTFTGDVVFSGTGTNITFDQSADDFIFNDGAKVVVGTGQDLQIFHSSTQNFIRGRNTASPLYVDCCENLHIRHTDTDGSNEETMIKAVADGAVELYHNNTKKFETTTGGIEVFGSVVAENDGAGSGTSEIQLQPYGTDAYINCTASGNLYTRMGSSYDIRTRIDSSGNFYVNSGNVVIGTSGKGIDFSATGQANGMTSELLDDYEEGTWTPTSNVGSITTYSAHYVKIGKAVTAQAYIEFPSMSGSSGVQIAGFPYSAGGGDDIYSCAISSNANAGSQIQGQLSNVTLVLKAPNNGGFSVNTMSSKIIVFSIAYTTV